jgi:YidC/Oxa1 family membrane protein insertase
MIKELFTILLYQPLMNVLVFLYETIPGKDFGLAVIVTTILIRLALFPLSAKGVRAQRAINEIQPEIKEIQRKYKEDKEKQTKEILAVYKKAKISPFSSFSPILVQLPVLIALYRVFWDVQGTNFSKFLYSFISFPGEINSLFLGIDISKSGLIESNGSSSFLLGNMIIIIAAGIAQFFQMKMITNRQKKEKKKKDPSSEMAENMQKKMIYFFPFFTIFILLRLPSVIGLYWLTSTLFSIIQQHFILKKI